MKNLRKRITIVLVIAALFTILSACNKPDPFSYSYNTAELAEEIDAIIDGDDTLVSVDADYIRGSMKMEVSDYSEFVVKINAYGANIDEYGIFKASGKNQAADIKTAVEDYLQMRKDTWMTEYMPEEYPKLENAQVSSQGYYIMYAILADDERKQALTYFEGCFTEG